MTEVIFSYTRAQAINDGVLVDGRLGDLLEVSAQHVGPAPIAMTEGLFNLIRAAVENTKHCNDWKGVWHDVLWMSKGARRALAARFDGSAIQARFVVIITGAGRRRNHVLQVGLALDENGRACWTYMLDGED